MSILLYNVLQKNKNSKALENDQANDSLVLLNFIFVTLVNGCQVYVSRILPLLFTGFSLFIVELIASIVITISFFYHALLLLPYVLSIGKYLLV